MVLSDDLLELDDEINQIAVKHKSTAGALWLWCCARRCNGSVQCGFVGGAADAIHPPTEAG